MTTLICRFFSHTKSAKIFSIAFVSFVKSSVIFVVKIIIAILSSCQKNRSALFHIFVSLREKFPLSMFTQAGLFHKCENDIVGQGGQHQSEQ